MLIFAFHYQNFIIIETFITYILILSFHCAACSSLATRSTFRQRPMRTSLEAYLGSISLGLSISLVVAATWLGLGSTTATPMIRTASARTCNGGLSKISGYVTFGFLAFKHSLADNRCSNFPCFTYVHGCRNTSRRLRVRRHGVTLSYTSCAG